MGFNVVPESEMRPKVRSKFVYGPAAMEQQDNMRTNVDVSMCGNKSRPGPLSP